MLKNCYNFQTRPFPGGSNSTSRCQTMRSVQLEKSISQKRRKTLCDMQKMVVEI